MATWDATFHTKPDGDDKPSTLDNEQRNHRDAVEERMKNEHDTYTAADTDGSAAADWRHREGSARAYYQSAEPTNQPGTEGAALGAGDDGRLWIDSDNDRSYFFNGSDFVKLCFSETETLDAGVAWTVPTYITRVKATIIAAGGGGGGAPNIGGPGNPGAVGGDTVFNAVTSTGGSAGTGGGTSGTGADSTDGLCSGNGGEGGYLSTSIPGATGGGGQIKVSYFDVTPADSIDYSLGAGGAGGAALGGSYAGGDGGDGQVILEY